MLRSRSCRDSLSAAPAPAVGSLLISAVAIPASPQKMRGGVSQPEAHVFLLSALQLSPSTPADLAREHVDRESLGGHSRHRGEGFPSRLVVSAVFVVPRTSSQPSLSTTNKPSLLHTRLLQGGTMYSPTDRGRAFGILPLPYVVPPLCWGAAVLLGAIHFRAQLSRADAAAVCSASHGGDFFFFCEATCRLSSCGAADHERGQSQSWAQIQTRVESTNRNRCP